MKDRINSNEYFMRIAELAATKATCDRAEVGAVLVKDGRIIATGYNGAPAGMSHCDDVGHLMKDKHCIRTVHAEINCIIQAAKFGISIEDSILYVTHRPCHNCCKVLINANIDKVYYRIDYNDSQNDIYKEKLEMVKI